MYLDYYGLQREPFHITPDPYFFYLSQSHKEAFASMIYGLKNRKGFIAVTGEVGLGKTTVLRAFLEQWTKKEKIKTIFIFNTDISFKGLLKIILEELGVDIPVRLDSADSRQAAPDEKEAIFELVQVLHKALIREYKEGQNVILIIDEAQNMPVETLERLRMLSNLETTKDKLLQIFLIGQPELEAKLEKTELRQLRQRIAIRTTLKPLNKKETIHYISSRLKKSGALANTIFSSRALNKIFKYSKGTPRSINILCDNALVTGLGTGKQKITPRIIKEVQADLQGRRSRASRRKLSYAFVVFPILLLILGWFSPYREHVLTGIQEQPHFARVSDSFSFLETPGKSPITKDKDDQTPPAGSTEQSDIADSPGENEASRSISETVSDKSAPREQPAAPVQIPAEKVSQKRYLVSGDTKPSAPLRPQKGISDSSQKRDGQGEIDVFDQDRPEAPEEREARAKDPDRTLYQRLSPQEKSIYSRLEAEISVFSELSPTRRKVLIAMAKQTTVQGLMTFDKMLAALERKDFEEAANQMIYSSWRARVKDKADELAGVMKNGESDIQLLD
ncbi:MAG: AAA family ATPase [Desulfohalobiaceae bacterium]|nr:AAA family ATPase [Desulfohalobiaceae bacterium]